MFHRAVTSRKKLTTDKLRSLHNIVINVHETGISNNSSLPEAFNQHVEKLKQQEEQKKTKWNEVINIGEECKFHRYSIIKTQSRFQYIWDGHLGTEKPQPTESSLLRTPSHRFNPHIAQGRQNLDTRWNKSSKRRHLTVQFQMGSNSFKTDKKWNRFILYLLTTLPNIVWIKRKLPLLDYSNYVRLSSNALMCCVWSDRLARGSILRTRPNISLLSLRTCCNVFLSSMRRKGSRLFWSYF